VRKSEEVKVRCDVAEKAAWQGRWESEGFESLSDFIRATMNDRCAQEQAPAEAPESAESRVRDLTEEEQVELWERQNARLDGTLLVDNAISTLEDERERRTETCACGRPPFVFCGRCDG
jgi:hypothetical protein